MRPAAIFCAALALCGCTAPNSAGAIGLINALKASGAAACGQIVVAYTPFSNSSCVCVDNPVGGAASTITVGTTQCTITTQAAPPVTKSTP